MDWGTAPTYVNLKMNGNIATVDYGGMSIIEHKGYYVQLERAEIRIYGTNTNGSSRYVLLGTRTMNGAWFDAHDIDVELRTDTLITPYVYAEVWGYFSWMPLPSGGFSYWSGPTTDSSVSIWETGFESCHPVGPSLQIDAKQGEMKLKVKVQRNSDQTMWEKDSALEYDVLPIAAYVEGGPWYAITEKKTKIGTTALIFNLEDSAFKDYVFVRFKCILLTRDYPTDYPDQYGPETVSVRRNSKPGTPSMVLPPENARETYSTSDVFVRLQAGADPDGTLQKYTVTCNGAKSAELEYRGTADFVTSSHSINATTNDGVADCNTPLSVQIPVVAPPWTRGELIEPNTPVLAAQLAQLRTGVDHVRHYYGMGAAQYTDAVLAPTETVIKAVHFAELQAALDEVLSGFRPDFKVTWEEIAPNGRIKASHINQLRGVIEQL